jgi:hypothetical protein
MQKLFESFRKYSILTEEQLLVESRIKDAKKKYPQLVDTGLLDILIDADPSGNYKYLMWAANMLDKELKGSPGQVMANYQVEAENIAEYLQKFHKLQPYIRDEAKKFKDINKITSLDSLIALVQSLERIKLDRERAKEEKKQQKKEAMQDSTILINDDDFMMVRPTSAQASCYWGKGTKWCISATESQNYFAQYTNEGKSFYFLFSKNKDNFEEGDWSTYQKLALVFLTDGSFEEGYNAEDQQMTERDVLEIIASNLLGSTVSDAYQEYTRYGNMKELKAEAPTAYSILADRMKADGLAPEDSVDEWWNDTVDDIWYTIRAAAEDDAQENPAGPTDEDFQDLLDAASLQHIDVNVDQYDIGRWGWAASISFDFDNLEGWGDENLDERDLENEVHKILDDNYIYAEEIEFYDNRIYVRIADGENYGESDIDRFSSFVDGLAEADAQYEDTYQELIEMFIEEGALDISDTAYGQLRNIAKTQEYKHFEADASGGSVSYFIKMDLKIPEIGEVVQSLTRDLKAVGDELGLGDFDHSKVLKYLNIEFQELFSQKIGPTNFSFGTNYLLDALSKYFLEAQNQAKKQLNLPGIPAAEIRQLVTPSKFQIKWATLNIAEKSANLLLGMALGRNDDEEQMKALAEFIDYFDKNYDDFEKIVRSVLVKGLHSAAGEVKGYAESSFFAPYGSLPPSYEPTAVDYTARTAHQAGLRPFVENRKRRGIRITIKK